MTNEQNKNFECCDYTFRRRRGGTDVGSQSTDTIKLNFMDPLVVPTGLGSKPLATFRF
jgi:hypothetical protein